MTTPELPPPSPSAGKRLANGLAWLLRFFVRLVIVVVLAAAVLAGLVYGGTWLYRQVIQPLQDSVQRLETERSTQEQAAQQIDQSLDGLRSRVDALERSNDLARQTAAGHYRPPG